MDGFEVHKAFPSVIGAIDGSYIPIKAPIECPENYVNRKNFHSVVLQVVCDHEMRFTDCYCGQPGSVHDARVFRNSDIFNKVSNDHDRFFSPQLPFFGDAAYPLTTSIMTPFKDNGHLTPQQRKCNYIHSSTRMVIERAFALLKGSFRRLKFVDISRVQDIPTMVIVACVLRNISLAKEYQCLLDFMGNCDEEINGFESVLTPNITAVQKRLEIMQYLS